MTFTFPWRKNAEVKRNICAYLDRLDECSQTFGTACRSYLENGPGEDFYRKCTENHQSESAADDIRREIEQTLFERELLPESREDLLLLLETADRIPGAMQGALNILSLEKPAVPEYLRKDFSELVSVNTKIPSLVNEAISALMQDPGKTREIDLQVDRQESLSDRIQQQVLRSLFESDLSLAEKLQFKDLVRTIGSISDRCQETADLAGIIAIKRRI